MKEVQSQLGSTEFSVSAGGARLLGFERLDSIEGAAGGFPFFIESSGRSGGEDLAGYEWEESTGGEAEAVRQYLDVGCEVIDEEVVEEVFDGFGVCHGEFLSVMRFQGFR